jgi:hypothetical protein
MRDVSSLALHNSYLPFATLCCGFQNFHTGLGGLMAIRPPADCFSKRLSFLRYVALAFACAAVMPAQQPSAFVRGRVLVHFREFVSSAQAKNVVAGMRARSIGEIPQIGMHIVELPSNASETAYLNAFRQRSEVALVELDRVHPPQQLTPNDPSYASQWYLPRIDAPNAWPLTTGTGNIIIAIADTGVDPTHPDLVSKLVPGWNVTGNNSDTHDVYGHGTMVAGTAAAASNNGKGVASVAWNCWIMPVRISQDNGYAYDSTIAGGITWAADHGARVVNVSYKVTGSATVSAAAKYFHGKGGVVTVAGGNYSTFESLPDDPYMVTVAATDSTDVLYSWSNRGTHLDLTAPGCVTTTVNGGSYGGACGTSVAAPVVAGVAALVLSANPGLSATQAITLLRQTADDLGAAGWDSTFGAGRVNAARAVQQAFSGTSSADTASPGVSFVSPVNGATVSGAAGIQVAATDNVGVASVTVTLNGASLGTDTTAPYSFSWNTPNWANGAYTLVATAADSAGNSAATSITVTVSNPSAAADTTAPTVAITSPLSGSTVSGNSVITAAAGDNVGVTRVEFYLDNRLLATTTADPFKCRWNTNKRAGVHSLQAKAYDAAGNVGVSTVVTITVLR